MQPHVYARSEEGVNQFFAKVHGLVGLGIGLSALVSAFMLTIFRHHIVYIITVHPYLYLLFVILEMVFVAFATKKAAENHPWALPLYLIFSISNGYVLSIVVALYTKVAVYQAFITAAGMFLALSLIGRFTKKDLSGIGRASMAGLLGLIIAGIVNLFLRSSLISFILAIFGVVIFSGLIAWHNQAIRQIYEEHDGDVAPGWAVSLAFSLYLDFINLFLKLLRLYAGRRR